MVEEDSSWPYFGIWWIESLLPVQSLATDLSLSHIVPVGIFIFQFVLGLLLVPGHLYEIGTFPPDPEGFSSEPHAAMSVLESHPFPPFLPEPVLCPISPIKAVSRSPCFDSLCSFQDQQVLTTHQEYCR